MIVGVLFIKSIHFFASLGKFAVGTVPNLGLLCLIAAQQVFQGLARTKADKEAHCRAYNAIGNHKTDLSQLWLARQTGFLCVCVCVRVYVWVWVMKWAYFGMFQK